MGCAPTPPDRRMGEGPSPYRGVGAAECDCPPDACLCAFAEGFNESQERLRAERDRYRDALEAISERTCESTTDRIAREALDD